ncbi:Outer membrane phospholipase A [Oopsacas minuta]|uniref:Outer membrane phospholipase A n=1 Tax=Oopsacas minuta TaxID=111878 RepID=A0AAV7KA42_9METZ|nr:Outer membrane phospholipase A [Oopsacas minuta]
MAIPDTGLDVGGEDRFDALLLEIERTFLECYKILDTRKHLLLGEVSKLKELDQKHFDILKAMEQIEMVKRATNEVITQNAIAEDKQYVVSLWDDKIRQLKKEQEKLDPICEVKFVSNLIELEYCMNTFHLRECVAKFGKRKEPVAMKRITNEGDNITGFDLTVDKETNLLYVTDYYKGLVHIFSQEGELLKSFGEQRLVSPYGISLSEGFVYVSDQDSIFKFVKSGEYLNDTNSSNIEFDFYPRGICVYLQSVYVCNSGRNSIELFNSDLVYTNRFGEDKLKYPIDINAHNEKIFVLTELDEFFLVHIYVPILKSIGLVDFSGHHGRIERRTSFIPIAGLSTLTISGL